MAIQNGSSDYQKRKRTQMTKTRVISKRNLVRECLILEEHLKYYREFFTNTNIYHKPYNTIRSQVTHVKDPTDKLKKCGVIYHIKCNECDHDYVGETGRQLDIRMKEHMAKTSSAIHEHCDSTGHTFNPSESKVLSSEDNFWKRKVKEAIEIKQRKPSLNRDEGLELPQVYNGLLVSHDPTKVMRSCDYYRSSLQSCRRRRCDISEISKVRIEN